MNIAKEIDSLKEEAETVGKKVTELAEEELEQVSGGMSINGNCPGCGKRISGMVPLICKYCGYQIG